MTPAPEMHLSHSEKGMKRAYAERDWTRLERALNEMEKVVALTIMTWLVESTSALPG
jgi:hypothetical protein